jgi:hypothetical protein
VVKISAYPPRFSLHLLPLAALSLILALAGALGGWERRDSPLTDGPPAGGGPTGP